MAKAGDMNTTFFHKSVKIQQHKRLISGLINSQGQWCTSPEQILDILTSFHTKHWQLSSISEQEKSTLTSILSTISPTITGIVNNSFSLVSLKKKLDKLFFISLIIMSLAQMGRN